MRSMRRNARRPGVKPAVQWSDVSGQWLFAGAAATSTATLIQLQSPANLSNLTADPPEDLTILRMVGDFSVQLSANASSWTLALLVADVTWTPGTTVSVDNDKRLLWQQTFTNNDGSAIRDWYPPGMFEDGTTVFPQANNPTHLDITPRVRIEPGKALTLVAYENVGAGTLTSSSVSMRVLYKRSRRR